MEPPPDLPPVPLDPKGPADPLQDPGAVPGDAMLDALERSIVFPKDRADSIARHDPLLIDGLAWQLDALERSIEDSGPRLPKCDPPTSDEDLPPGAPPVEPATQLPEPPPATTDAPPRSSVSQPPAGLDRPRPAPPSARGPVPPGQGSHSRGRTNAGGGDSSLSHCPELGELIHKPKDCQGCPKYRHWPDGTDEKPRECWFDWEMGQRLREHDREDRGEDGADDA